MKPAELLHLARQWLAEYFEGVEIDPEHLCARRMVASIHVRVEAEELVADPRQEQALELIEDPRPAPRTGGLAMLAELDDPDLADWCAMLLEDEEEQVQLAALHTLAGCADTDPGQIVPLANSPSDRLRAAAVAVLARHGGPEAPRWCEYGLKDPSPCVRLETSAMLDQLDPARHRGVFELALYDPNPVIAHRARKLTAHKGYGKPTW